MKDYKYLRILDIDDLFILASLLDNTQPLHHIAKILRITPPALSHRIKRYREHIPNFDFSTTSSAVKSLSPETKAFCTKAKKALDVLGLYDEEKAA